MSHPSDHPEVIDPDDDAPPDSYAPAYLILDRSDPDDPMWVLVHVVAACEAKVDASGEPDDADRVTALVWCTDHLDRTVYSSPVPGSGHVYRLEDGDA